MDRIAPVFPSNNAHQMLGFLFLLISRISCQDKYTESLEIEQMDDGKVLAIFNFNRTIKNFNAHYDLLPKAIGEIFSAFKVKEMHLSFTQGRWNPDRWGYNPNHSPAGAQLWTWIDEKSDKQWEGLTNALAGLFCASLNFMDQTVTSQPRHAFSSNAQEYLQNDSLYFSSLPRESVCTENLTPWAKLLPCQTKVMYLYLSFLAVCKLLTLGRHCSVIEFT